MGSKIMTGALTLNEIIVHPQGIPSTSSPFWENFIQPVPKNEDNLKDTQEIPDRETQMPLADEDTSVFVTLKQNELSKYQEFIFDKTINDLYVTIENLRSYYDSNGIELPTEENLDKSIKLIKDFISQNILPSKVSTSIEEGVSIVFKKNRLAMHLELYNDGDIGYIIEDVKKRKLLENKVVSGLEEIVKRVNNFYN